MKTRTPLFIAALALFCTFCPSPVKADQEHKIKVERAIDDQMTILRKIENHLNVIKNKTSADERALALAKLCDEYKEAKAREDAAEKKLSEAEEKAIEQRYEKNLDALEDKVEDLAEKIYKTHKCYGSKDIEKSIKYLAD